MPALWSTAYVGVMLLVGCAATVTVRRRFGSTAKLNAPNGSDRIVENLGLTLSLGPGLAGMLCFWLSVLGFKPTRDLILGMGVAAGILLGLSAWWSRSRRPEHALADSSAPQIPGNIRWGKHLASVLPLLLLLLTANVLVLIPAIAYGQMEWDACVIWALKAKVMYYEPLYWHRPSYFHDLAYNFSHLDYPLLLPSLIAGAYGMMGAIHEPLGKVAIPMLFAAQTMLAYSAARMWVGRTGSLMLAVLLLCPAANILRTAHGNADAILATFYLGSVFLLARWVRQADRSDVVLAALFTIFVATTKAEGLPLAGINAAVLLAATACAGCARGRWPDAGIFIVIVGVGIGGWIAWRAGIPHTSDDYFGRFSFVLIWKNAARVTLVLDGYRARFLSIRDWGFLWVALPLMAALGWRAFGRPETRALWALLILHLSLYGLAYMVTDWVDVRALQQVTLDRLLLHAAPAAMLLFAAHWAGHTSGIPIRVA